MEVASQLFMDAAATHPLQGGENAQPEPDLGAQLCGGFQGHNTTVRRTPVQRIFTIRRQTENACTGA